MNNFFCILHMRRKIKKLLQPVFENQQILTRASQPVKNRLVFAILKFSYKLCADDEDEMDKE